MAQYPALPLFTDAYMADTRHLTTAQHGAYLLLLMTAWRMPDCKLPDDDKLLARWAGLDLRNWVKMRPYIIDQFWATDECGKLYQRRLQDERKFADTVRRKNSEAGKASALKYKERHSTNVVTKPQPNLNPLSLPSPTIKDNTIEVLSKKPNSRKTRISEDWMLPQEWGDWAEGQGLTGEEILREAEKFRDRQISKGAAYSNWQATWRNWIRNHIDWSKNNAILHTKIK
jgi:uncharacterized protein YdaU (DUF1376 family)